MTGIGLETIATRAAEAKLEVFGALRTAEEPGLPRGTRTLVLLGPHGSDFWQHVQAAAEFRDGRKDPLDRWSRRVIGRMACDFRAKALFPFGGPPHHPFPDWALRSGRAWISPVGLLVHDRAGLMLSYRGALAFREALDLPAETPVASPCTDCAGQPCRTACPAGALGPQGYDVPACQSWLDTAPGADCLEAGCRVRRACPLSVAHGRDPEQSGFHMRAFHG